MSNPAVTNISDAGLAVELKQHLFHVDFRDDDRATTLLLTVKSMQTVGVAGIQRSSILEVISDVRSATGEKIRISKTLSPIDRARMEQAAIMILHDIENHRPPFPRPLAEYSCRATQDIALGGAQKDGGDWLCFVEVRDGDRILRCSLGDRDGMRNFRASLKQMENF